MLKEPLSFVEYARKPIRIIGVKINGKNPRQELLKRLNVKNNPQRSKEIERTIVQVVTRVLDGNYTALAQKDNLTEVEKQLRQQAPSLFTGGSAEETAFLAYRLVIYIHKLRRKRLLERKRKPGSVGQVSQGSSRHRSVDLDLTLSDSDESVDILDEDHNECPKPREHMGYQLAEVPWTPKQAEQSFPLNLSAAMPNSSISNQSHLVSNVVAPDDPASAQRQPAVRQSNSISSARSADISQPSLMENTTNPPIDTIQRFLSTCDPPMDQFLTPFIKSGCLNETYLQSIAMLSPERRESILRKILHSGVEDEDTSSATDIDIWILDIHLQNYEFNTKHC